MIFSVMYYMNCCKLFVFFFILKFVCIDNEKIINFIFFKIGLKFDVLKKIYM